MGGKLHLNIEHVTFLATPFCGFFASADAKVSGGTLNFEMVSLVSRRNDLF